MKEKRGAVVALGASKILSRLRRDCLPLYAAQSSFFICISAIPFAIFTLSLFRLAAPSLTDDLLSLISDLIPKASRPLFEDISAQILSRPSASLVSLSALGALWSSSRGLSALISGVAGIYGAREGALPFRRAAGNLLCTALLSVMMALSLSLLVFGKYLRAAAVASFGEAPIFLRYREALLFFVLALNFMLLYRFASCGGTFSRLFREGKREPFASHLPGAAAASFGWIVFSKLYSLYFERSGAFSRLYGSLAAVAFFMLWVYFCVMIILLGAEINRAIKE